MRGTGAYDACARSLTAVANVENVTLTLFVWCLPPPDVGGRAGNHGGRAENLMIGSSPIHTGARLPHLEEMQGTVAVKHISRGKKRKLQCPYICWFQHHHPHLRLCCMRFDAESKLSVALWHKHSMQRVPAKSIYNRL